MRLRNAGVVFLSAILLVSGCKSSQSSNNAGANAPANSAGANPGAAPGENMDQGTGAPAREMNQPAPPAAAAPSNGAAQPGAPAEASGPAQPSAPAELSVPAGTRLRVRLSQSLTTRDTVDGQKFSGILVSAVRPRGGEAFAQGTRVSGIVTDSKSPGKFKGEGVLSVRLTDVGGLPVRTAVYSQVVKGKGRRTAKFIGGGTGLGAIIGGIAGGGKGAAIGALAGAGAGTATGAATDNKEVELPAEAVITFRLTAPIRR